MLILVAPEHHTPFKSIVCIGASLGSGSVKASRCDNTLPTHSYRRLFGTRCAECGKQSSKTAGKVTGQVAAEALVSES